MGTDTAAALTQVEQARGALETDIATLLDRLPPGARIARTAATGGGAVAALGIARKVLSKRSKDKKYVREVEREARIQARAIAAAFAAAHVPTVSTRELVERQVPSAPGPSPRPMAAVVRDAADDDDDGSALLLTLLLVAVGAGVAWFLNARQQPDADDIWLEREDESPT